MEYSLLSIEGRRNRGGARDADCIRNRLSLPAFRFLFGLRGAFVRESENRRGGRRAFLFARNTRVTTHSTIRSRVTFRPFPFAL